MNAYLRRMIARVGQSDFAKVHAALRRQVSSTAFRSA